MHLRAEALPLVAKILQSATSHLGKEYCASILLWVSRTVGSFVLRQRLINLH